MKRLFLSSSIDDTASHIAKKIGQPGARLLFVTTASEPEGGDLAWLQRHRAALVACGFSVTDYTLTGKTGGQVEQALAAQDILYMSGGNGLYLLQQIQQAQCTDAITRFITQGHVYIGSSAGSYITAPTIYAAYTEQAAKAAPTLSGFEGLGLVDFMVLPHWGSDTFKDVYFGSRLQHAYKQDDKFILLNDRQYVEVCDDFYRIVAV